MKIVLALALALVASPLEPDLPTAAFYYWKTHWHASPALREALGAKKLYLRFFDVHWNDAKGAPTPDAPIEFDEPLPEGVEIVPVVYLTNSVFLNLPYADVEALADHVMAKIERLQKTQPRELQFDCDWSDHSRRSYFHFLQRVRRKAKGVTLSVTIRLHQVKYSARTGVPPADRGMLMFYNFGAITAETTRSSIFNAEDASKYVRFIAGYALPLDLSLPMFSWAIHSRQGKVLGLLDAQVGFVAQSSYFFHGHYLQQGDLISVEHTDLSVTNQAAAMAAHAGHYGTVAFFDIDERTLPQYANDDLQKILRYFR